MWASIPEWNLNTERTVVFSQQILTHPRNLLLHLKCSSNFHLEVPSLPDCVSGQEMAFLLINSSAFKSQLLMAETVPPGISTDAALSKQHPQKQSQCCSELVCTTSWEKCCYLLSPPRNYSWSSQHSLAQCPTGALRLFCKELSRTLPPSWRVNCHHLPQPFLKGEQEMLSWVDLGKKQGG